jgi:hypothetical protein
MRKYLELNMVARRNKTLERTACVPFDLRFGSGFARVCGGGLSAFVR